MAEKKNGKNGGNGGDGEDRVQFPASRKRMIVGILCLALSIFLLLAGFNHGGVAGESVYSFLDYFLGVGYFLLPFFLLLCAFLSLKRLNYPFVWFKATGGILFCFGILGSVEFFSDKSGGLIGKSITKLLLTWFDFYATAVLLFTLILVSLLTLFDPTPCLSLLKAGFAAILSFFKRLSGEPKESDLLIVGGEPEGENIAPTDEEQQKTQQVAEGMVPEETTNKTIEEELDVSQKISSPKRYGRAFVPPPLSLLERDRGRADVGDIKANANIIKRTLQNFGIIVEMDEISIGPTVTRYALKPAEGVKLSRIVALQNDLALALAAHPIRLEAPIPGKSLVGVEIPNSTKSLVGLSNLLSSEEFRDSQKALLFALGKGISGKSYFANLSKMPHLLIAGATGSGKSVAIHAIITSLLYRNSPENLRFMMIDPKRVELTLYNKIPHLLTPVITEAKKAIMSLKWAAKEMERRYNILESEAVRDIESYHKNVFEPSLAKAQKKDDAAMMPEQLPYIVIIIDELADIMSSYPRELEAAIVRLAQMSRAVGIHLVLSTQRPSVDIITGLIKANIPARIALQVASQIDSRTILDMSGAEKLLGAGDMLYLSGEMSQPQRIQCPYISETEVKKVVGFLKSEYRDELPDEISLGNEPSSGTLFGTEEDEEIDDDLYEAAREEVIKAGKASTSYLQRKLRVGYSRAARLVDMLEERGVIGPPDGSKPREVIGAVPPQNEVPTSS